MHLKQVSSHFLCIFLHFMQTIMLLYNFLCCFTKLSNIAKLLNKPIKHTKNVIGL